uniref:Neurotransmitter-gated ion-channel ligand-binding domain-containing protein n=1 Tax=Parascaris equorum TaxID=6256 RepID=A0A914RYV4_PAREQ
MQSAITKYFHLRVVIFSHTVRRISGNLQRLVGNENLLLKKIFKKDNYDYTQPSDSPTQVLPFMFIDHIEELDQKQQIMNMHCSVLYHWIDKRIVWEPKDYGNVNRITRPKSDFPRMKMRSDQAMQYYNTDVTLMSNGAVYAQVSLSVRSTCSFDFSNYPKDEQICLLTMFTPLPMSRLKFSRWTTLTKRSDIFGRDSERKKWKYAKDDALHCSLRNQIPKGHFLLFHINRSTTLLHRNKLPPDHLHTPLCVAQVASDALLLETPLM